ncbi:aspartate kinase [Lishizhenia sp.]|uniref:aspartate kinase n=1 Tax=Lishizhenia sp. TaxID=2497594 RepID=UPI00299E2F97|nr:aspartate kinase [Lishizhenia sp.]MDX1445321.1 aspartate kinase [Lishizhenia sp.]
MRVFKFGGASVKDADAVRNVGEILRLFPEDKILVVVSAMGKTTNAMEEIARHLYEKNYDEFRSLVADRKRFHLQIVDALFEEKNHPIFTTVKTIFNDLGNRVNVPIAENYDFEYDQIVSLGEVVSTKIVQAYIDNLYHNSAWLDARKLVRTNHAYREAEVDWEKTQSLIQKAIAEHADKKIFVTQGFLGHTDEGFTTTLGREGSDFTAGIFAYCLDAVDVTIWKDVPGMLNADPKWFDNTVKLDSISFREAIELAYYGASVIHPKTIKPLQNKQIPLFVKSFLNPEAEGTVIQSSMENDDLVPSFIFKMDQVLISVTPKDFSFIVEENLSRIFAVLSACNAKINIMQNSALSFSFCVDGKTNLTCLQEKLSEEFEVKVNEGLELVTIRHYDTETIDRLTVGKETLLEQKTRQTARLVIKNVMAE